jgi:DNA adenine methylase
MLQYIENPRIGCDTNKYLIALLRCIRDTPQSLPKNNLDLTEEEYNFLKTSYRGLPSTMHARIGFAGFPVSFGAKWFAGWSRNRRGDDYVRRAFENAQRQSAKLQGAIFGVRDYRRLLFSSKKPAIIYCDPPYRNSTGYFVGFNHDLFFNWCRERATEGHIVLVSEYEAPDGFECVWELEHTVNFASTRKVADSRVERLFIIKSYGV